LYRIDNVYNEDIDESSVGIFDGWLWFSIEHTEDRIHLNVGEEYFDYRGTQGLFLLRKFLKKRNFRIEVRTLEYEGVAFDDSIILRDDESTIYISNFAHSLQVTDDPKAISDIEGRYR
jgi:hypothetical protein